MSGGKKKFGGGGQGAKPPAPSPAPSPPTPYRGLGGEFEGRAGGLRSPGPPLNQSKTLRLCVPVVEVSPVRARSRYVRAARKGLWAELRLDYLDQPDLKKLFRTLPGPVIATNRPPAEGGRWSGNEQDRQRLLEEALEWGVHALDVEFSAEEAWRREMYARRGKTRLILSWHDFTGTPESRTLTKQFHAMLDQEADILKLVTYAQTPEDNLRLLDLIPRARAAGWEIIAFCMGPLGKWSRMAAAFLGSFLTFAPFNPKQASAPGQATVDEMRRIWRILRK